MATEGPKERPPNPTCAECPVGGRGVGPALGRAYLKGTSGGFIAHRKGLRKMEKRKRKPEF